MKKNTPNDTVKKKGCVKENFKKSDSKTFRVRSKNRRNSFFVILRDLMREGKSLRQRLF